jgi:hypothetical protein
MNVLRKIFEYFERFVIKAWDLENPVDFSEEELLDKTLRLWRLVYVYPSISISIYFRASASNAHSFRQRFAVYRAKADEAQIWLTPDRLLEVIKECDEKAPLMLTNYLQ